jgi:hypothetical protein
VIDLEWGTISAIDNSFDPLDPLDPFDGLIIPDAVRITTTDTTDYFFQPGSGDVTRSAVAQARERHSAYFRIGSYLASVTPASNTFIGSVLSSVVTDAELLSYDGLVGAQVTLDELAAGLTAVSPDSGLDSEISYQTLVLATATALQNQGGNTAAVNLLNDMASTSSDVEYVTVGQLVDAEAGGGSPAGSATYDVMGLLTGAAFLADGDHAVSIPSSQVNITGVGDVTFDLTVVEGPRVGGPHVGATAKTGQFGMTITPDVDVSTSNVTQNLCNLSAPGRTLLGGLLGGLLNFAVCALPPPLGGVLNRAVSLRVELTGNIDVEAAGALATLTSIDCDATPPTITVDPDPVPIEILNDVVMSISATVAGQDIGQVAEVTLQAGAIAPGSADPVTFDYSAEFGPPPTRVGSTTLGLSSLLSVSSANVTLLGGSVNLGPIINPVLTPLLSGLNSTFGQINSNLLSPIANGLGLSFAGADLTALTMACDLVNPRLVG